MKTSLRTKLLSVSAAVIVGFAGFSLFAASNANAATPDASSYGTCSQRVTPNYTLHVCIKVSGSNGRTITGRAWGSPYTSVTAICHVVNFTCVKAVGGGGPLTKDNLPNGTYHIVYESNAGTLDSVSRTIG